jgi:hypothetical protein
MSLAINTTRMERQVRNLGRAALFVGVALLIVITGMTARYGWTQTPGGWEDKISQAAINGVIDLTGAVSAAMWGAFFAMRFRLAGIAVTFLAFGCAAYTYQAVVGFQSSNRETLAAARERASVMSNAYIDWAKTVTTKAIEGDKDRKGQPRTDALMAGIDAVGTQVVGQMKMLQGGELVVSPDSQATTFARMLGIKEADARSYTVTVTSVLIIFIHYMSFWAYGFIRQRLEPAVVLLNSGPRAAGFSEKSGLFPDTVQKVGVQMARKDVPPAQRDGGCCQAYDGGHRDGRCDHRCIGPMGCWPVPPKEARMETTNAISMASSSEASQSGAPASWFRNSASLVGRRHGGGAGRHHWGHPHVMPR